MNIENYLNDGANYKAQAVMCLMRYSANEVSFITENIERNADNQELIENLHFETQVGRYENCREQGYVFSLICNYSQVVHYCVFEHRNSDQIHVIRFKGVFINTPSIDNIWEGRKNKYDTDIAFSADEIVQCRDWIVADMEKQGIDYIQNEYIPRMLELQAKKKSAIQG